MIRMKKSSKSALPYPKNVNMLECLNHLLRWSYSTNLDFSKAPYISYNFCNDLILAEMRSNYILYYFILETFKNSKKWLTQIKNASYFPKFRKYCDTRKKPNRYTLCPNFIFPQVHALPSSITARVELYVYTINIPGNYNMGYSYVRVVCMFIIDHYIIIQLSSAM